MRLWGVTLAMATCLATGCAQWSPPGAMWPPGYFPGYGSTGPIPAELQNPLLIAGANRDVLWDQLVDVVDDYFKIDREDRVRQLGDLQTEGRLETYPRPSATILEPWEHDSVTMFDRWEATLQSIRRRASVRVIPVDGGYLVEVTVYKELEDLPKPELGFAGLFNLRNDDSLRRLSTPVGSGVATLGWIPQGRDQALEQRILCQLEKRVAAPAAPY